MKDSLLTQFTLHYAAHESPLRTPKRSGELVKLASETPSNTVLVVLLTRNLLGLLHG